MRILALGDIIGSPGRRAIKEALPEMRRRHAVDMVVANAENAAGGIGLTSATADELLSSGADVLTSGNHIWAQKEIYPYLEGELPILRPLNYPPGVGGHGFLIHDGVMVVNLIGRTFIGSFDCPFQTMDRFLAEHRDDAKIIIVDFHAEATSEKCAMGRYLDGRVSAVVGTHTHIGTVDAEIFPKGTAYVSDIGMVGPAESIIGDDIDAVLQRFLTGIPVRLPVAKGPVIINGILVDIDEQTGRARSIQRLREEVK
jgi:metallophosphoesterase (TIGR00282 family)